MTQKKTWWKKYRKDVMIVLILLTTVVTGVMGYHWTDTSNKPLWWNFWVVAGVTCDLLWIVAWAIFWNSDKRSKSA